MLAECRISMHSRVGFIAFVLYVTLDLSNPFVAGAFNFNPDECVEATQRDQRADVVDDRATQTAQPVRQLQAEMQRVVARAPAPTPRSDWRSPAPVAHVLSASPPSPTEDH